MLSVEGLKLSGDPTVQPGLRTVATEGSAGTVCAADPARWMFRATSLELLPVPWQSSWCPQAWGSLKTSGVALPKVETERMDWNGTVEIVKQLIHPRQDCAREGAGLDLSCRKKRRWVKEEGKGGLHRKL